MGTWSVAEAKAKFSQLVDEAQNRGPQTITRNGRVTAVVVSAEEWERKATRRGNLAEFLLASPLRSSRANIVRLPMRLRKTTL
jgi:prevent-host-death family protein